MTEPLSVVFQRRAIREAKCLPSGTRRVEPAPDAWRPTTTRARRAATRSAMPCSRCARRARPRAPSLPMRHRPRLHRHPSQEKQAFETTLRRLELPDTHLHLLRRRRRRAIPGRAGNERCQHRREGLLLELVVERRRDVRFAARVLHALLAAQHAQHHETAALRDEVEILRLEKPLRFAPPRPPAAAGSGSTSLSFACCHGCPPCSVARCGWALRRRRGR